MTASRSATGRPLTAGRRQAAMGTALWKPGGGEGLEEVARRLWVRHAPAATPWRALRRQPQTATAPGPAGPSCHPVAKGGALEPLGNSQGFGARVPYPLNFIPTSLPPRPHILDPQKCGVLASRAAALQLRGSGPLRSAGSQRRVSGRGSSGGVGGESEGGVGILDPRSLTRRAPPRRDALPFSPGSDRVLDARAAAGAGSERTPSGFPRSSQVAKGPRRGFPIPFLPAWGVGGHSQRTPAPCPPPHKRALVVRTKNKHTGGYCFFNSALRALRVAFSCFPLSSLLSNFPSFVSFISLFLSFF